MRGERSGSGSGSGSGPREGLGLGVGVGVGVGEGQMGAGVWHPLGSMLTLPDWERQRCSGRTLRRARRTASIETKSMTAWETIAL